MHGEKTPRLAIVINHTEAERMHAACQRVGMFNDYLEVPEVPIPEVGRVKKLGPIRATKIAQSLSAEVLRLQTSLQTVRNFNTGSRPLNLPANARAQAAELLGPSIARNTAHLETTTQVLGELGTHLSTLGVTDEFLPEQPPTRE